MKKLSKLIGVALIALTMASCERGGGTSPSEPIIDYTTSGPHAGEAYYKMDPSEQPVAFSKVRKSAGYKADMMPVGSPKALVIPVDFTDYSCSTKQSLLRWGGCDGIRSDMEKAFFGKPEETTWESLASYYEKTSYGKLKMEGEVTDWYHYENTAASLMQNTQSTAIRSAQVLRAAVRNWKNNIYEEILEKNRVEHQDKSEDYLEAISLEEAQEKYKEFDVNEDGYLDAVYVIYAVEDYSVQGSPGYGYGDGNGDIFWAFTYWDGQQTANKDNPETCTYFWASYDFMYKDRDAKGDYIRDENGKILPDATTFIHETGHILGLEDYYTYDYNDDYPPLGGIDMMDNNIGDHNAYSKSLLGWTNPYYVQDDCEITLKPFATSGDCVILGRTFGRTRSLMEEYLILEYYSPADDTLNYWHSTHAFEGTYPKTFQDYGVKVMHVDSRLGGFRISTIAGESGNDYYTFKGFVDGVDPRYDKVDIAFTNTRSRNPENMEDFRLLSLVESKGKKGLVNGEYRSVTDESLFHTGDKFDDEYYKDFRFHNGSQVGYSFEIKEMNADGVTISFKKTF